MSEDREPTRYEIAMQALRDLANDANETPARRRRARQVVDDEMRTTPPSIPVAATRGAERHRTSGGMFMRTQAEEQGWSRR